MFGSVAESPGRLWCHGGEGIESTLPLEPGITVRIKCMEVCSWWMLSSHSPAGFSPVTLEGHEIVDSCCLKKKKKNVRHLRLVFPLVSWMICSAAAVGLCFMFMFLSCHLSTFLQTFIYIFSRFCLLSITTSKQDEGEVDHAGHGCLLSALSGHDLLLHMAV